MLEALLPYFLFVFSIYMAQILTFRLMKWPVNKRNIVWSLVAGVALVSLFRFISEMPFNLKIMNTVACVFFIVIFGMTYLRNNLAFEDNKRLLPINCLLSVVLGGFLGTLLTTWVLIGYYRYFYV